MTSLPGTQPYLRHGKLWTEAVHPPTPPWATVLRRDPATHAVERMERRKASRGTWFGVRIPGWRDLRDRPPPEVAGRLYGQAVRQLELQRMRIGARCRTVGYEDLCRDPAGTLRELTSRCGLEFDGEFRDLVPEKLKSANFKWPTFLDEETRAAIRSEDPEFFDRHREAERLLVSAGS